MGCVSLATLSLVACARPISSGAARPLALVYAGPQGCSNCVAAVTAALRASEYDWRVVLVGPGTDAPGIPDLLREASLYVQPGGGSDLASTMRDLQPVEADIRQFVRLGGAYLGLCFGAYLAGKDPGFGLLPGDTYGWAGSVGASIEDDRDAVVPIWWRGKLRHMFFQDGPAFFIAPGSDVKVIARYDNGAIATLAARVGRGRVVVSGPHPEAPRAWFRAAGLSNPDGYQDGLMQDLLSECWLREVPRGS